MPYSYTICNRCFPTRPDLTRRFFFPEENKMGAWDGIELWPSLRVVGALAWEMGVTRSTIHAIFSSLPTRDLDRRI